MKETETLTTWDGQNGVKFRVVKHTEIRVEIYHPDAGGWARAEQQGERKVLCDLGLMRTDIYKE
jgi:hypothetical protein